MALIIKRYALAAGLNPAELSGHSLRSDFATTAAKTSAGILKIMETTYWISSSLSFSAAASASPSVQRFATVFHHQRAHLSSASQRGDRFGVARASAARSVCS
jgi:hypothetical protein